MFDNDSLIIVPTRLSQEKVIRDILQKSSNNSVISPNITTFKSLLNDIYPYSVYNDSPVSAKSISSTTRFVLMKDIVTKLYKSPEFGYFDKIQNLNGFITSVITIIDELKGAFVSIDSFKKIVGKMDSVKFREVLAIYSLYEEELDKRNLIDATDRNIISLSTLKENFHKISFLKNVREIKVYFFNDFTPIEYEIIKVLGEKGLKIEISFAGDEKREIFDRKIKQIEHRLFRGDQKNIRTHLEIPNDGIAGEIKYLLNNLFLYPVDKIPSNQKINLLSANDPLSEIYVICREIKRLLEEDPSLKLSEIGVIFREIFEYSNDIRRIFAEYNLHIFIRSRDSLNVNSIVRLVQNLFHIKRVNFEREAVLKVIMQCSNNPEISKEKIELIIYKACILEGDLNQWLNRLDWLKSKSEKLKKNDSESIDESEIECTKQVITDFFNMTDGLVKEQEFGGFISEIEQFVKQFFMEKIEDDSDNLKIENLRQINDFFDLLEELKAVSKEAEIDKKVYQPDDFLSIFDYVMFSKSISDVSLPIDRIFVMNPLDARGLCFKILFIGELNEGKFPKSLSYKPIFKDSERKQINSFLSNDEFAYPLQTTSDEELNEEILFFLLLCAVHQKLYLSFSRTDRLEKPMLKSPLLEEIEKIVDFSQEDKIDDQDDFIVPRVERCFTEKEICNRISMELCKKERLFEKASFSKTDGLVVYNNLASIDEFKDCFSDIFYRIDKEHLREGYFLREKDNDKLLNKWIGYIDSDGVKKELGNQFKSGFLWGATILEDYYVCPFKFFLKYSMKMMPFEKPAYEIRMTDEGTIIHKILRDFFDRLKKENKLPVDNFIKFRDDMLQVANEFLDGFERDGYVGNEDYYKIKKEKIINTLLTVLKKEANQTVIDKHRFIPSYFELQFGDVKYVKEQQDMDPIIIKNPECEDIFLGGLIDRIDVCKDGFRVIDYKGSASNIAKLNVKEFGKKNFQIPIYILAARRLLSGDMSEFQTEEGTFFIYRNVDPHKIIAKANKNMEFFDVFFELDEKRRDEFAKDNQPNLANIVCEFVKKIMNGDFQINPVECDKFCDYQNICRYVVNRKLNMTES